MANKEMTILGEFSEWQRLFEASLSGLALRPGTHDGKAACAAEIADAGLMVWVRYRDQRDALLKAEREKANKRGRR
jgi:hypothetical protein